VLLRKPEQSQQVTFLELFFDLVFIFALTQVSHRLVEDLTTQRHIVLPEAGQTLLLFLALWLVWAVTAGLADVFDPEAPQTQLIVVASMFGSLVMAIMLPEAFGGRGLAFAGAYVAINIGRCVTFLIAERGTEAQRGFVRPLLWYAMSAVAWISGSLFPESVARGVLWTLAVAMDYTGAVLGYPTPGLGRAPVSQIPVAAEHMSERYRQFFIIALGELILTIGVTYSGSSLGAGPTAAFVVSFATTVLLWRIYIYRAGELLSAAIAAARRPARVAGSAAFAHLFMIAGIVAIAVAYELVIEHPFGRTDADWIGVIVGGPALFVAGRAIFEYAVFARVSRSRLVGLLMLAVVSPAMVLVPPLAAAIASALVLAGIAISDAARGKRGPLEPVSPPR